MCIFHRQNNRQCIYIRTGLGYEWPVSRWRNFRDCRNQVVGFETAPIGSCWRITQRRNAFEMDERTVMKIATQPKEKKEEARPLASLAESGVSGGLVNCCVHDSERELLREQLDKENLALRGEVDRVSMFEEIVGTSPALEAVHSRAIKVAATDSTVLITGETGTGKELVARAIHRRSDRVSRPFVGVNCAAIPRDLIASELFGHEKGAFTGATQQRLGRFELANGGTIFLDEVGELPVETQIALLRVLQEHEFERVGGTRRIRADGRGIAATNRDLQAAISAGSFRSDLFYRLNVFPIEMPSLPDRRAATTLLIHSSTDTTTPHSH